MVLAVFDQLGTCKDTLVKTPLEMHPCKDIHKGRCDIKCEQEFGQCKKRLILLGIKASVQVLNLLCKYKHAVVNPHWRQRAGIEFICKG